LIVVDNDVAQRIGDRRAGIEVTMAKTDFKSVDEYIASYPADVQAILQLVRRTIRKAVPAAEERISYQMPTYDSLRGPLIAFAAWKGTTPSMAPPITSSQRSRNDLVCYKVVHIEGAGHNVRRENKAQTIEVMKAFLSGT
jgi:hypothetical protein